MVAPGQLSRGTLPTIGRVEGKQDQVRLPAWIGVWDKGVPDGTAAAASGCDILVALLPAIQQAAVGDVA